jgi:putative endonuclease
MYYTYILKCTDKYGKISYYVGYTNNIDRRLVEHKKGCGAKYTQNKDVILLKYWQYDNQWKAMHIEHYLKTHRAVKIRIIKYYEENV